jgi:multimeric flavodoxin WrbA
MQLDTYKQPLPSPKVLGIGGSPRKKGNTDHLLSEVLGGVGQENIALEQIQLRDYDFKACIGCEGCRKAKECTGLKDQMQSLYPKIIDSQSMVWISPAHNYNVTALMKTFIDRLYTFYNFDDNRPRGWNSQLSHQNRKAVVIAIGEQVNKEDLGFTLEGMKLTLQALGYEIVDEMTVYGVFDRGGVKEHPDVMKRARDLGVELSRAMAN